MKMAHQKMCKLLLILETMLRKTLVITWQQISSSISTAVTFVKILNSLVSCAFGNNQSQKAKNTIFMDSKQKSKSGSVGWRLIFKFLHCQQTIANNPSPLLLLAFRHFFSDVSPSTIPLNPVFAFCIRKTALCGTRIFSQHPPKEKKFAFSSNIQQLSIRTLQSQLAPPPLHKYC